MSLWEEIRQNRLRVFRTVNLYLCFFSLGLFSSIVGPTLPDLQANTGSNTATIGYVLSGRFGGVVIGCFLGVYIFNRFRRLLLFFILLLITSLFFIAVPYLTNVYLLITNFVLTGILAGAIDLGGNVLCLDLWPNNAGPFLQALHFSYGVGSVISPLIAEPFLSPEKRDPTNNTNVTTSTTPTTPLPIDEQLGNIAVPYVVIGVFMAAVALSHLVSFLIDPAEISSNCEKARPYSQIPGKLLPRLLVGLSTVFLASYVCLENTFGQFLTTFVIKSRLNMDKSQGSFMTSTFWGTYCVVRGFCIFGATKIKPVYFLVFDLCVITVTCVILAIFGQQYPSAMWICAAFLGLGGSSCFPAGFAWLEMYVGISNVISAIVSLVAGSAGFSTSLLVSHFMDEYPPIYIYVICALATICLCSFAVQLRLTHYITRVLDLTQRGSVQILNSNESID